MVLANDHKFIQYEKLDLHNRIVLRSTRQTCKLAKEARYSTVQS